MPIVIQPTSRPIEIISAIKATPPLQAKEYKAVPPEATILCLQREYAVISAADDSIKYVGTKNIGSCIFIYIYNEQQQLVFHCDSINTPKFSELINHFKNKNNLKIFMIGGNSKNKYSEIILASIINQLINAAKSNSISMEITGQKLLANNDFQSTDRLHFIYDKFIEKSDLLHRYLYGKPLDLSLITLTPDNLKVQNDLNTKERIFVGLLSQVFAFMSEKALNALKYFPEFTNPDSIYKYINSLNGTAFNMLDSAFSKASLYEGASQLRHFVLDVNTRDIFTIPESAITQLENIRNARLIDEFSLSFHDYFCCYNRGIYQVPPLSDFFEEKCKTQALASRKAIEKEIADCFSGNNKLLIGKILLRYIQHYHARITDVFVIKHYNSAIQYTPTTFKKIKCSKNIGLEETLQTGPQIIYNNVTLPEKFIITNNAMGSNPGP